MRYELPDFLKSAKKSLVLGQRNQLRVSDPVVARQQWNLISQTGRGDQFVGGIALEIQPSGIQTDLSRERPDLNARQRACQQRTVESQRDSAPLMELGDLP